MAYIHQLSIREDNYTYLIHLDAVTIAIDPGQAQPVLDYLHQHGCSLALILNTHYHPDHCQGNLLLKQQTACRVMGPDARIAGIDEVFSGESRLPEPATDISIYATPGHTLTDCCYYLPADSGFAGALFSGDTLFSGGCGRVFEGSVEMLFNSLQKLKSLPGETLIYCGHEYTLENYRFAESIEPNSVAVRKKRLQVQLQREQGQPTIPVSLAEELKTNPFLRCADPALRAALKMEQASELEVFAALRRRKDRF